MGRPRRFHHRESLRPIGKRVGNGQAQPVKKDTAITRAAAGEQASGIPKKILVQGDWKKMTFPETPLKRMRLMGDGIRARGMHFRPIKRYGR